MKKFTILKDLCHFYKKPQEFFGSKRNIQHDITTQKREWFQKTVGATTCTDLQQLLCLSRLSACSKLSFYNDFDWPIKWVLNDHQLVILSRGNLFFKMFFLKSDISNVSVQIDDKLLTYFVAYENTAKLPAQGKYTGKCLRVFFDNGARQLKQVTLAKLFSRGWRRILKTNTDHTIELNLDKYDYISVSLSCCCESLIVDSSFNKKYSCDYTIFNETCTINKKQ